MHMYFTIEIEVHLAAGNPIYDVYKKMFRMQYARVLPIPNTQYDIHMNV